MIRHVLAAICPNGHGRVVAQEAHALAKQLGAKLTVLHVLPRPLPRLILTRHLDADRAAREAWLKADWFLDALLRELHDPRATRELREAQELDVAHDVANAAQELGADLIVVGTHAQPRPRVSFGQRLLRCTHLPVTLVGPALPTREPEERPRPSLRRLTDLPSAVPVPGPAVTAGSA